MWIKRKINKPDYVIEVEKIIDNARLISENLYKSLKLKSLLIFFEQAFFLYFLEDIRIINHEKTKEYSDLILSFLLEVLNKSYQKEFKTKNTIDEIFILRWETYKKYLIKDDYALSEHFYYDVFCYQAEQLACIDKDKMFSKYNPFPITPLERTPIRASGAVYTMILKKALSNNLEIYLNFLNN